MKKYLFLYKENDTNDRDCVAYIENELVRFECEHYFGSVILNGACYSGADFAPYENVKTVLTKEEYNELIEFNNSIRELGCGIVKGDERYQKGIKLCNNIKHVYDKLLSEENEELFNQVIQEEKEYLMEEYNFDEDDIDKIFNEYYLDYRDRGIVGCVFEDVYECGFEEAYSCGYVDDNEVQHRYFDFERFGEDLVDDDERYLELDDGRVVVLNY